MRMQLRNMLRLAHLQLNLDLEWIKELFDAGEDRWGTDETTFTLMLARRSWLMLRAIIQAYEGIAGSSLESAIESECSRDLRKGYKAIVRLAGNPGFYYARSIYKAIKVHLTSTWKIILSVRSLIPSVKNNSICLFRGQISWGNRSQLRQRTR